MLGCSLTTLSAFIATGVKLHSPEKNKDPVS